MMQNDLLIQSLIEINMITWHTHTQVITGARWRWAKFRALCRWLIGKLLVVVVHLTLLKYYRSPALQAITVNRSKSASIACWCLQQKRFHSKQLCYQDITSNYRSGFHDLGSIMLNALYNLSSVTVRTNSEDYPIKILARASSYPCRYQVTHGRLTSTHLHATINHYN